MFLPRFSIKRYFVFLIAITAIVLLVLNFGQKEIWSKYSNDLSSESAATDEHSGKKNGKPQLLEISSGIQDGDKDKEYDSKDDNDNIYQDSTPPQYSVTPWFAAGNTPRETGLPWYITGGSRRPSTTLINKKTGRRLARLFPSEDSNDRISNQLMFVPPSFEHNDETRIKTILLYNGYGAWNVKPGREIFTGPRCPVDRCLVTAKREHAKNADAIFYKDHFVHPGIHRPPRQIWMLYFLECPYHTQHIKYPEVFNWTATYRRDSDIVAPYEHWEYYNPNVKQVARMDRNYAQNKTKKVAWFVSNCGARNGRLQYAHELQKYIQVDIFGACGNMKCSRANADACFELLDKEYKFYLAFENSNCKDYITEKFFVNGLGRNILPIVMGARPGDYERSSPFKSYIHVDEFEGPRQLAEYLHRLDQDDELYNSYFRWKGTGEFINTYFWCRVCAMLHDDQMPAKSYKDVNEWWRGKGTCTLGSWRKVKYNKEEFNDYD